MLKEVERLKRAKLLKEKEIGERRRGFEMHREVDCVQGYRVACS